VTEKGAFDVVIVGGGFFGCCLALFLRSVTDRIIIVEEQLELMTRASCVNQARVHSGFHYPRSFVTALRSHELGSRFARDFNKAIVDDFQMLYAIARRRSQVTATRFLRTFQDMHAPISRASASDAALFNPALVEDVFACDEFAFDWTVLRDALHQRLVTHGIEVRHGRTAEYITFGEEFCAVTLDLGETVTGRVVFNVTYAGLNRLLLNSGLDPLPLKYELAEIALVSPPPDLTGKAVTVMDGPFFSMLPYPSAGLYSMTHVRYTPHRAWVDVPGTRPAYNVAASNPTESRWRHMMMDAKRYLPCVGATEYGHSLFDVKAVLTRHERDDGRPILIHQHHSDPKFYSVMGGKIDNIYDLFHFVPSLDSAFRQADDRYLLGTL
jgi:glycine/D-amino acid oxidase-like deaminating enzyme